MGLGGPGRTRVRLGRFLGFSQEFLDLCLTYVLRLCNNVDMQQAREGVRSMLRTLIGAAGFGALYCVYVALGYVLATIDTVTGVLA